LIPLAKNIKRYLSKEVIIIATLSVTALVTSLTGVMYSTKKDVIIDIDGKQIAVQTAKATIGETLKENGIEVKLFDYVSLPYDTKLHKMKQNQVSIKKAVPIHVTVDGNDLKLLTNKGSVGEALVSSSISFSKTDKVVGTTLLDPVKSDMKFAITRIKEGTISEKKDIPFETLVKDNNRLERGREVTIVEGKQGIAEKTYKVIYENGILIAKDLVKEAILQNPITKVVERGTVFPSFKTSRGDVVRYSKVLSMRATAYTASFADTGKRPGDPGFGITYSGVKARRGIIAVDPKVIPIGTRLYVQIAGDTPDYGYAVAGDIGGAIKGDLIDLYFDDSSTVINWGCKRCKVYILDD